MRLPCAGAMTGTNGGRAGGYGCARSHLGDHSSCARAFGGSCVTQMCWSTFLTSGSEAQHRSGQQLGHGAQAAAAVGAGSRLGRSGGKSALLWKASGHL